MSTVQFLEPDWPQPESIGTIITTRSGGVSEAPYDSLNLAMHVADDPSHVSQNRKAVSECCGVSTDTYQWQWMEQVHSANVATINSAIDPPAADGLRTTQKGIVCCVLTADCLPVLICNNAGTEVAVAHGGWRGLAGGILTNMLDSMQSMPEMLMVWLGPAIGPCHFEVGADVREQFLGGDLGGEVEQHFEPKPAGKFMVDLYGIAKSQLSSLGVKQIYGGEYCTYRDSDLFFSYRREGETGRMLSAIYIKP